jgi:NTE family protein
VKSTPSHSSHPLPKAAGRALVLGGGGSTGNAWLIGVVAGLVDAGLDVTSADLTIGTSAGSTAAAQFAGSPPAELFAAILAAEARPQTGAPDLEHRSSRGTVVNHLERTGAIIAASADVSDMRRRMGAAALELLAASDGAWQAHWRSTVASRLSASKWPQRSLLITAVAAATGDPVVFDRDSDVDLVDAVAASCAGGLPYGIGDRMFIDGGYRSNAENADLADGCARVLVLSPFGGRTRLPLSWGMHLAAQVEALRARGSAVETIFPDADSADLFGPRGMDVSLRPVAARAGYEVGKVRSAEVTAMWNRGEPR